MVQHTTSPMMFFSSTRRLQSRCHGIWLQNWRNNMLMHVKNFCGALKQEVMVSWWELLLEVKPGFTTTSWEPRKQARNGAIPPHQTEEVRTQRSARRVMMTIFGMNKVSFCNITCPGRTLSSVPHTHLLGNYLWPAIKSKQCGILSTCCNTTMLSPILPVQWLQSLGTCTSSIFHICCTLQTLPPVITTPSDHPKRWGEERLSGLMKRCNKWYMSGCTHDQKTFFLQFVSASNAMETM